MTLIFFVVTLCVNKLFSIDDARHVKIEIDIKSIVFLPAQHVHVVVSVSGFLSRSLDFPKPLCSLSLVYLLFAE
jgi:hypothetical protein